jgi:hypothetical protein
VRERERERERELKHENLNIFSSNMWIYPSNSYQST